MSGKQLVTWTFRTRPEDTHNLNALWVAAFDYQAAERAAVALGYVSPSPRGMCVRDAHETARILLTQTPETPAPIDIVIRSDGRVEPLTKLGGLES